MNTGTGKPSPVSRRDFLKSTSAALAGGMLLGRVPAAAGDASGETAGDPTLRVAVIGCGGRGTGAAAQAMNTGRDVKVVAMAESFRDRLEASLERLQAAHPDQVDVPPEHRFVGFDAYRDAIALADVVILATPPGFRPAHFEAAIAAGKHVFMEKPVAVDAPGVRRVLAAGERAKEKGLKVGVGFQRRHQPGYLETIARLQDGAIGDLVSMRAYWNSAGVWVRPRQPEWTEMEYQMRNWFYFNWLCGDHIVEQHVHNIDVVNWVKDAFPVAAQGQGGRRFRTGKDHGEIFDHHFVEFEYADGSRLFSQCRHQPGWATVSEYAQGTRGTAEIHRYVIAGERSWRFDGEDRNPYQAEQDALFDAIRNNKAFNEVEYSAKSTLAAILGRMCTYSNERLTWDRAFASDLDIGPSKLGWELPPPTLPDEEGRYPIPVPGETRVV